MATISGHVDLILQAASVRFVPATFVRDPANSVADFSTPVYPSQNDKDLFTALIGENTSDAVATDEIYAGVTGRVIGESVSTSFQAGVIGISAVDYAGGSADPVLTNAYGVAGFGLEGQGGVYGYSSDGIAGAFKKETVYDGHSVVSISGNSGALGALQINGQGGTCIVGTTSGNIAARFETDSLTHAGIDVTTPATSAGYGVDVTGNNGVKVVASGIGLSVAGSGGFTKDSIVSTATGGGYAGKFTSSSATSMYCENTATIDSNANALYAKTPTTGAAYAVRAVGKYGGSFTGNTGGIALQVNGNGATNALFLNHTSSTGISATGTSGTSLKLYTATGQCAQITSSSASNSTDLVDISYLGTKSALVVASNTTSNTDNAVEISHAGTTSGTTALYVTSASHGIDAVSTGTGTQDHGIRGACSTSSNSYGVVGTGKNGGYFTATGGTALTVIGTAKVSKLVKTDDTDGTIELYDNTTPFALAFTYRYKFIT